LCAPTFFHEMLDQHFLPNVGPMFFNIFTKCWTNVYISHDLLKFCFNIFNEISTFFQYFSWWSGVPTMAVAAWCGAPTDHGRGGLGRRTSWGALAECVAHGGRTARRRADGDGKEGARRRGAVGSRVGGRREARRWSMRGGEEALRREGGGGPERGNAVALGWPGSTPRMQRRRAAGVLLYIA
jgi:hypothetical protein